MNNINAMTAAIRSAEQALRAAAAMLEEQSDRGLHASPATPGQVMLVEGKNVHEWREVALRNGDEVRRILHQRTVDPFPAAVRKQLGLPVSTDSARVLSTLVERLRSLHNLEDHRRDVLALLGNGTYAHTVEQIKKLQDAVGEFREDRDRLEKLLQDAHDIQKETQRDLEVAQSDRRFYLHMRDGYKARAEELEAECANLRQVQGFYQRGESLIVKAHQLQDFLPCKVKGGLGDWLSLDEVQQWGDYCEVYQANRLLMSPRQGDSVEIRR